MGGGGDTKLRMGTVGHMACGAQSKNTIISAT